MENIILMLLSFIKNLVINDKYFKYNKEEVIYWKNRNYYLSAAVLLTFGAPLIFYGSYIFYRSGYKLYAAFELLLYFLSAVIIMNKKVNIEIKKYCITHGLYLLSIFLLLTTGGIGAGMVCVLFSMIIMGCILNKKGIVTSVILNLAVFLLITVLLSIGIFDGTHMEIYKSVWLINALTTQACGIMVLILINTIFTGLEKQARQIKKSETLLATSEIKHKAMIKNISDAIVIIDEQGKILYQSPNLSKIFPNISIINNNTGTFFDIFPTDEKILIISSINDLLSEDGKQITVEAKYRNATNEEKYLEMTAVNLTKDENINGILINFSDITKRILEAHQIIFLNQHDSLTGLYNRAFFEDSKIIHDNEAELPISIMIGDINGLKIINDSLGHAEGDRLLVNISNIIVSCCRKTDIVARIGGDEFNILMPKTNNEEAIEIMNKIHAKCEEYNQMTNGDIHHLSISLGCSTKNSLNEKLENVIKIAEDFMYKRKLLEGRSFHSSIISSMKMALYEKSNETEEHAHRLVKLSKALGKAIGLTNQQFDELELFSTLHDIGKIGVDNQILNKPSKLTEEEWIKMRKHSEIGYRIAMASPELMSVAYDILTHHERWDGKGYPQGLHGEEIPLLSRILALADSFDAMTEDRPYRKGMSVREALEEIGRNAGTQFDPELSKIFVDKIIGSNY